MSTPVAEFDRGMFESPTEAEEALIAAGKARQVRDSHDQDWRLEILAEEPAQAAPEPAPVAPVARDPFESAPKPRQAVPAPQKALESPAAMPTREAKPAKAAKPVPRMPTRPAASQAEHAKALWASKRLKEKPYALLCALALHRAMGVHFGPKDKPGEFGDPLAYAVELVVRDTGIKARAVKDLMRYVVEEGFFRRLDSGKGGRGKGGSTAATYVPTVPEWWRSE